LSFAAVAAAVGRPEVVGGVASSVLQFDDVVDGVGAWASADGAGGVAVEDVVAVVAVVGVVVCVVRRHRSRVDRGALPHTP
jgi:hypothetical protein